MSKNSDKSYQENNGCGPSTKANIGYWSGVAETLSYHGKDADNGDIAKLRSPTAKGSSKAA